MHSSKSFLPSAYLSAALAFCILVASCTEDAPSQKKVNTPTPSSFSVKMVLPHDPTAFTQGLVFEKGKLYESTGNDYSWIAEVNPSSGVHDKKVVLDPHYFGEGITILHNKIYQLTWKNRVGFIYGLAPFKKLGMFTYDFEGWGITTDGNQLFISDGTDKIYALDSTHLQVTRTLSVTENGNRVDKLNELEYAGGFLYANRWQTPHIYKIDLKNGNVVAKYDLSAITKEIELENPNADVLNGIAYNPQSNDFLLTGKWWHKSYVVSFH